MVPPPDRASARLHSWRCDRSAALAGLLSTTSCRSNAAVRRRLANDDWADLLKRLDRLGLMSTYHQFFGEDFGKETRPTHFFKGKQASPFHLDYCFVPASWMPRVESVEVGAYDDWSKYSDHPPVTVDVRS
jgi:hypothetical protein